jgi:hypothetical protein
MRGGWGALIINNKGTLIFLSLLTMLLSGCGGAGQEKDGLPNEEELLSEISRLPMLYTVEAEVEVLVEGHGKNGTAEWKSVFGSRDIIVPVRAYLKAGIDLSKMTDVEVKGDKVYVSLPDPVIEIESTEIPWEKVVTSVSGLRDKFSNREKEFLTRKGRIKILEDMGNLDLIQPAQEHAEQIVSNLIRGMGYKPVLRARPIYDEREIIRFVKD